MYPNEPTEEQVTNEKLERIDLMIKNWPYIKMKPNVKQGSKFAARNSSILERFANFIDNTPQKVDTLTNITIEHAHSRQNQQILAQTVKDRMDARRERLEQQFRQA